MSYFERLSLTPPKLNTVYVVHSLFLQNDFNKPPTDCYIDGVFVKLEDAWTCALQDMRESLGYEDEDERWAVDKLPKNMEQLTKFVCEILNEDDCSFKARDCDMDPSWSWRVNNVKYHIFTIRVQW